MQAEHGVGLRILERAFLNHLFRAPTLAGQCGVEARTFFGGLEQEFDRSGQFVFMSVSTSAVAIKIAVCVSCPQACITSTSRPSICPWPLKRMKALPAP